jgi:hypothetical protein
LRNLNSAQNLSDNQEVLASAVIELALTVRFSKNARESAGQLMRQETPHG